MAAGLRSLWVLSVSIAVGLMVGANALAANRGGGDPIVVHFGTPVALNWDETVTYAGEPLLEFKVSRFLIASTGWKATLTIKNLSANAYKIDTVYLIVGRSRSLSTFLHRSSGTYGFTPDRFTNPAWSDATAINPWRKCCRVGQTWTGVASFIYRPNTQLNLMTLPESLRYEKIGTTGTAYARFEIGSILPLPGYPLSGEHLSNESNADEAATVIPDELVLKVPAR